MATATAAALTLAPAASAASDASVARVSGNVTYNSGSGATNQVVLSQDASGNVVVTDTVGLTGLTGCLNLTLQTVHCGSGVSEISVLLFDGRDEVTQETTLPTRVQGSADTNVLRSGRAPAESATLFLGGAGFDAVDYSRADRFVTVTADGAANDGRPGDRDNIAADVEQIIGTSFPDRLTGSGVGNVLDGAFGPDVVSGLGGDDRFPEGSRANGSDVLLGGVGSDVADYSSRTADVTITLDAVADDGQAGEGDRVREVETVATGSGDDVLVGAVGGEVFGAGAGDDELTGRGGSDRMSGDAGNDVMSGGAGDDAILARDGERDIVQCGLGGADRATIDAGLDEVRGCEIVG